MGVSRGPIRRGLGSPRARRTGCSQAAPAEPTWLACRARISTRSSACAGALNGWLSNMRACGRLRRILTSCKPWWMPWLPPSRGASARRKRLNSTYAFTMSCIRPAGISVCSTTGLRCGHRSTSSCSSRNVASADFRDAVVRGHQEILDAIKARRQSAGARRERAAHAGRV